VGGVEQLADLIGLVGEGRGLGLEVGILGAEADGADGDGELLEQIVAAVFADFDDGVYADDGGGGAQLLAESAVGAGAFEGFELPGEDVDVEALADLVDGAQAALGVAAAE